MKIQNAVQKIKTLNLGQLFVTSERITLSSKYNDMNILAFGASASKNSINKTFAHFSADQFIGHHINKLDLLDFPLPIYTIDHEKEIGFPKNAELFMEKIASADLIIISFAEHNGSYTAWFKNLFDWLTRINTKFLEDKKLLLLSTSPGARGGSSVLASALDRLPRHGGEVVGSFSLPNFETNFDSKTNFMNESLQIQYQEMFLKIK